MPATLTSLETRIKAYLSDTTSLVFSTSLVDEGLRLALGQYNLVLVGAGSASLATINGLDGAGATTTLPAADSLLVLGAAGYAAESRIVKRSESFNLSQKVEMDLNTWGKSRVQEFNQGLNQLRLSALRNAAAAPFPTAADATPTGWLTDDADTTGQDI